jgi:hypothetical protein
VHALNLGAAITVSLCVYFLPTVMALIRNRQRRTAIFLINLFFGWTVIGWIAAMLSMAEQRKLDNELARSGQKDTGTWSFDHSSDTRLAQHDDWVLT